MSVSSQGEGGQSDKWMSLDSKSISSVAFDRLTNVLKVHYVNGDTWQYKDVPYEKYQHMIYASSSGKYLQREIIPLHPGEKLHDGPPDALK